MQLNSRRRASLSKRRKKLKEGGEDIHNIDDLDWFLGNSASSSSSVPQARWSSGPRGVEAASKPIPVESHRGKRLQRLHHGLKPQQSLEDACSPSDIACTSSGLNSIIELMKPKTSGQERKKTIAQLIHQVVPEKEMVHAEPLKPLEAFPPMNARPEGASSKPRQSHYQFFASLCPTEDDAEKRKIVEKKVAAAGKKLNSKFPRMNSFYQQSSRLFLHSASRDSSTTVLGRGAAGLSKLDGVRDQGVHDFSKDAMPTSKTFLKRSSSKEITRSSTTDVGKIMLSGPKKNSCRCLRLVVFGRVGDEDAKSKKEAEKIFEEEKGTYQDVVKFYQAWKELDADFSGEVTFRELLDFGRMRGLVPMHERALKAVLNPDSIDERYKVIQMSELMLIIWPKAQMADRVWMNGIVDQLALAGGDHITTEPEPLSEDLILQFKEAFVGIQKTHGHVTLRNLVDAGVITQDMVYETMRSHVHLGLQEDGQLGLQDFMQVMCPKGYFVPKLDELPEMQGATGEIVDYWKSIT